LLRRRVQQQRQQRHQRPLRGAGRRGWPLRRGPRLAVHRQPGKAPRLLAGGRFDGHPGLVLTPNWFFEFGPVLSMLLAPLPSDPPTAALNVNPGPALVGARVTLVASASSDPLDRPIV